MEVVTREYAVDRKSLSVQIGQFRCAAVKKMDSMRIAALGRQAHTGALYNYTNDSIANVQPGTVCFIILLAERISFARNSFQILKLSTLK